jgi:hypothetical protein
MGRIQSPSMAKKRQTDKSSFDARILRVQATFWRHGFRLGENARTLPISNDNGIT